MRVQPRSVAPSPRRFDAPRARLHASVSLGVLGATVALGCVSAGADVHLAPLYTRSSTAGGGIRSEAAFGMLLAERARPDGPLDAWSVRPLAGWRREPDGPAGDASRAGVAWRAEFLHPLGRVVSGARTSSSWFLPLYTWKSRETAGGGRRWTFLSLPGVWLAKEDGDWSSIAWFPVGGHVEQFLTYDEIDFVLFPLWSRAYRDGKRSQHFLYPIVGWTFGGGETSWRLFPLWLHAEVDGFYERDAYLWPLFHLQENDKHLGPRSSERMWMIWPLYGRLAKGTYRSHSFLWPLFGYASDPRAGFRAIDAPWPLVRIQSGGKRPLADERFRVWPFYSHFRGDRLESWNVMWPLVHRRIERYPDAERHAFFGFPFWSSWKRTATTGEESSWRKLWPLYQVRDEHGVRTFSTPAPYPFHWDARFDHHWAWPFELWRRSTRGDDVTRERAWGGLWYRERDAHEDRRSFTGLWSRRTYRRAGRRVQETSLLFGLLRWRSMEGAGTELLAPALPGPGWPAERSSELLCAPPPEPGVHENEEPR
jgi:hypothetical protein